MLFLLYVNSIHDFTGCIVLTEQVLHIVIIEHLSSDIFTDIPQGIHFLCSCLSCLSDIYCSYKKSQITENAGEQ